MTDFSPDNESPKKHTEKRKHAIRQTRSRFLMLAGTTLVGLSGCGFGFMAPKTTSANAEPLTLNMTSSETSLLSFFNTLKTSSSLQKNFMNDPTSTMIEAGAIENGSPIAISRTNKLLFYTICNFSLNDQIKTTLLGSPSFNKTVNELTSDNLNLQDYQTAKSDIQTDNGWEDTLNAVFGKLLSDSKFVELSGLNLDAQDSEAVSRQASTITQSIRQSRAIESERSTEGGVAVSLYAVAVAAGAVAANLVAVINVFALANANVYANANVVCSGTDPQSLFSNKNTQEWEDFLMLFLRHAEALNGITPLPHHGYPE